MTKASSTRFEVQPDLINPAASDQAKRLMEYLCSIYGKRMLTGQQIGVVSTPEFDMIHEVTGKYPAVGGFDFMNYSPSRVERGAECQDTDLAMKWWNRGGIVTFCWHWNAPKDLVDMPPDRTWGRGFYTNATTFDIAQAMAEPSSEEYGLIIRDIDAIAAELKRLQDAGIPVLWRPLHEASGGWFWWGQRPRALHCALEADVRTHDASPRIEQPDLGMERAAQRLVSGRFLRRYHRGGHLSACPGLRLAI